MAVKFTGAGGPSDLLAPLGVPNDLLDALDTAGIKVELGSSSLTLKMGNQFQKMAMPNGILTLAKEGKLHSSSKEALTGQILSFCKNVYKNWTGEPYQEKSKVNWGGLDIDPVLDNTASPAAQVFIGKSKGTGSMKASEPTFQEVPKAEAKGYILNVMSGTPVRLKDANQIYQAVKGTDSTSRYFVVALSDDLKIAARLLGTKLSVRVEGDVQKHATQLGQLGMMVNADKGYASVHMICDTENLLRRAIGSVLTGLDIEFTTGVPKVSLLSGKGS